MEQMDCVTDTIQLLGLGPVNACEDEFPEINRFQDLGSPSGISKEEKKRKKERSVSFY